MGGQTLKVVNHNRTKYSFLCLMFFQTALERELEPFNKSCNEGNQPQSREDYLQSDGREGEDVFLREAMKIKLGSCSVGNVAIRMVQKIFLQEELVNRNCRGSQGKQGLNPSKLATVKKYTFKLYPTPLGLKDQQWGKCVIAIDKFLRRQKRKDAAADKTSIVQCTGKGYTVRNYV